MISCGADPADATELLRLIDERANERRNPRVDEVGTERIGVVAHHLFIAKNRQGVFMRLPEADARSLSKGYRDLMTQKTHDSEVEGEGLSRELQAI